MREIYTFVGMSGVGKSHWSTRLKDLGFDLYSIDDLIAEKLSKVVLAYDIKNSINYRKSAVGDLAKWMGFPDDKRYIKNSKKYLETESKIVAQTLARALKSKKNTIIDTTGSVIYIDKETLGNLKKQTKIVYFDSPTSHLNNMFEVFKRDPKPIIWAGMYKPKKGEADNKALLRCYKELIQSRIKAYKALKGKKINYKWQFDKKRKATEVLKKIQG